MKLRNLGPSSRRWLTAVGIDSLEQLEDLGAVEVYLRVREASFGASFNLLWALQGAILDVAWNELPAEMKEDLRRQAGQASAERRKPLSRI